MPDAGVGGDGVDSDVVVRGVYALEDFFYVGLYLAGGGFEEVDGVLYAYAFTHKVAGSTAEAFFVADVVRDYPASGFGVGVGGIGGVGSGAGGFFHGWLRCVCVQARLLLSIAESRERVITASGCAESFQSCEGRH